MLLGGPKGFVFVKHVPPLILHQLRDISKKSIFDPVFTLPVPKTGLFFGTCLLVALITLACQKVFPNFSKKSCAGSQGLKRYLVGFLTPQQLIRIP